MEVKTELLQHFSWLFKLYILNYIVIYVEKRYSQRERQFKLNYIKLLSLIKIFY